MSQTQIRTGIEAAASEEEKPRYRRQVNWWLTALLAFVSLSILFPLYITITTALKTPAEAASGSLALPSDPQWGNFAEAIEVTNFPRAFLSSLVITVFAVGLTILTNSMVAYAIARNMDNRGLFKGLYYYFISALFVPFAILMLPIAKETAMLGLDNRVGLVFLYVIFGLSLNIFIYVGYLKSIPKELEEAAVIDGASVWTTFWQVIFPLLRPINATVGRSLAVLREVQESESSGEFSIEWGAVMADVVFDRVSRIYPGAPRPAVNRLSLEIADGEFLCLVGPSGCGKSTCLRMLAGLDEVNLGKIRIGNRDVTDVPAKDRDIAMVFQSYALYSHMTVFDNIAFSLKMAKGSQGGNPPACSQCGEDSGPRAVPGAKTCRLIRWSAAASRDGPGNRSPTAGFLHG
jgi:ABC-type glycerol-3-phosphate transport system permease component